MDGGVEAPIKVLQRFESVEVRGFGASLQLALLADVEFVLKDEFQKLSMAQAVGGGLLETHAQGLGQAGEAELFECGFEVGSVHVDGSGSGLMVEGAKQSGTQC